LFPTVLISGTISVTRKPPRKLPTRPRLVPSRVAAACWRAVGVWDGADWTTTAAGTQCPATATFGSPTVSGPVLIRMDMVRGRIWADLACPGFPVIPGAGCHFITACGPTSMALAGDGCLGHTAWVWVWEWVATDTAASADITAAGVMPTCIEAPPGTMRPSHRRACAAV